MALPKDPTTKTSSAAPPPKKPPVVDAEIFTPKPPPDLPPNVRVSPPAQAISNRSIYNINDDELIAALKDNPEYVLGRINWQKPNSYGHKRLEKILQSRPDFQPLVNRYAPNFFAPTPQTQPQPAAPPAQEIPEYKIPLEEKPAPKTPLGPDNAKFIENWLNGIKPGFYEYLAAKAKADPGKFSAATDRRAFTDNFLTYFAMYRGQLPEILLDELGKSLLWGALGPVGGVWEKYYYWDMQRKVKWMKNPLNPNALYYWLNSLPTQKAFKVAFIPFKAAWGIFSRGSGPLFTKAVYQYTERNPYNLDYGKSKLKEDYFFTPLLKFSQGTVKLADNLDKTIHWVNPEITNKHLNRVLDDLKQAKGQFLSSRIVGDELTRKNAATSFSKARRNLRNELNRHDGNFLQSWFNPLKKNLSRRLKHVSRDPLNGILALLAGSIMDIVIGIAGNFVRAAVSKVINHIPGLNALRAQINEFFTSSRWFRIANTARIGGATIGNFGKALVSPTSFSSSYVGAGAGGWVANALGLPILPGQIIGGGIGYGLGTFYKTSLNLVHDFRYFNPEGNGWIQKYEAAKPTSLKGWAIDAGAPGEQFIRSNYIKGFKPGPFSNFANWLYENPYARLPVNGFVIADLGVKLLGWNPWIAYPSFIAGDWIWQTRGAWSSAVTRWFPTTPLGRWIGNQVLSVQTWFTEKIFMRPIAWETSSLLGKMPVKWALRPFWQGLQNVWSTVQPYISNFFNPGFLMGMQFLGSAFMSMGLPWGVAHLVGGLAGAGAWWGVHAIYSAIAGKGAMSLAQWSAAGWIGYFGGLIAQGLLSLIGIHGAWMQFLPLAGSLIATVGVALIPGLGGFLGSFFAGLSTYNIAWALGVSSTAYAAGMAIAATVASIALVAGLTIFSGFVIFSAFWVPFQQVNWAGPESTFFSTQTTVTNSNGQLEICSKINVKNDLVTEVNYINHLVYNVFSGFTIADFDPSQPNKYVSRATRQDPYESLTNLLYNDSVSCPGFTNKNYSAHFDSDYILLPSLVGSPVHNTYLSTFTSCETGKKTIFELQLMFPQSSGLQQISDGYIDFLNQIKNDRNDGNNHNDTKAKLDATLDVLNKIISKFDDVVNLVKDAINQDSLASIQEKIDRAHALVETASKPENNPFIGKYDSFEAFQGDCNYQESTCREIYSIYQSYSAFFQGQLSTLYSLKRSADNPSANIVELKKQVEKTYYSLNSTLQDSKAQKQAIQDSKDLAVDLYGNDGFWNNWLSILTNLSGSQLTEIQNMLLAAFQDIFKKKFYFTPARTVYEVCLNAEWVRPDLLPYTFPVVVYFTNPPAMFNYNYFSPTVNFYTIPAP
ncbi:hypothetical protein KKE48_05235 [Patescibacteria group bacterium]|nr:hypothetical protein [Patescibacteria group bacterium]